MFKKLAAALVATALALTVASPALAFMCPKLIKEGRELLTKVSGEKREKAQMLLDKAQKLHEEGKHDESVGTAIEALMLLGKKVEIK